MTELKRQLRNFDVAVSQWILALPLGLRLFLAGLSDIGHPVSVAIISSALVIVAVWGGQAKLIWAAGLAFLALPISAVLKRSFRRMRPETAHSIGLHNYSFPSGHSYGSTVIYGLLAALAVARLPESLGLIIAGCLGLMVAAIGLSRISLGAHYPTDVVGGWVIGGLVLALIVSLVQP